MRLLSEVRRNPGELAKPASIAHFGPMADGDFRHTRAWIFDLDNTLYPAHCDLFAQIDARMTDYVARLLGVEEAEARRLQKEHYRVHGTTLNGLMKVHGTEPEDFLAFVHDIDLSGLTPDAQLQRGLERLPGRRYIFTNGCRDYAGRVLTQLGIAPLFSATRASPLSSSASARSTASRAGPMVEGVSASRSSQAASMAWMSWVMAQSRMVWRKPARSSVS
jgi:pyrimidine 5'-nucleotidase